MSLAEFKALNPDLDARRIRIGQQVKVYGKLPVTPESAPQLSPALPGEVKPITAEARAAFHEWKDYLRSNTLDNKLDVNNQVVCAKAYQLQTQFVALVRGTVAEPLWLKIVQVDQERGRAYFVASNNVVGLRLSKECDALEVELKAMVE